LFVFREGKANGEEQKDKDKDETKASAPYTADATAVEFASRGDAFRPSSDV